MTITIEQVDARSVGALIALYERAVGLYASLINVNAYHQPGVEAGKKAAQATIQLQSRVFAFLQNEKGKSFTSDEIASVLHMPEDTESIFKLLSHAALNPDHRIKTLAAVPPFHSGTTMYRLKGQRQMSSNVSKNGRTR